MWQHGTRFTKHRCIVRVAAATHDVHCHKQLLRATFLLNKFIYRKQLVKLLLDDTECRVHLPHLGLGQEIQLDVCGEEVSRPFNVDITA